MNFVSDFFGQPSCYLHSQVVGPPKKNLTVLAHNNLKITPDNFEDTLAKADNPNLDYIDSTWEKGARSRDSGEIKSRSPELIHPRTSRPSMDDRHDPLAAIKIQFKIEIGLALNSGS